MWRSTNSREEIDIRVAESRKPGDDLGATINRSKGGIDVTLSFPNKSLDLLLTFVSGGTMVRVRLTPCFRGIGLPWKSDGYLVASQSR